MRECESSSPRTQGTDATAPLPERTLWETRACRHAACALQPIKDESIERFFSKPEQEALRKVPLEHRLVVLDSFWTRKEAFLKGIGLGLMRDLDSFTVSIVPDQRGITCLHGPDTDGWTLEHLDPAEGYVGALCFNTTRMCVRRFSGE